MGFKARRKNIDVGKTSKAMILPALLEIKEESTMAGNRLVLCDPRAEIPEDELLKFYEKYVEPRFWEWYPKLCLKRDNTNSKEDTKQQQTQRGKGDYGQQAHNR